jgi:Nucleotidyl transferase AbiEii toxin, Type IV TA system
MLQAQQSNLEMIRRVAQRLGTLREEVAFLGGAATGLLLTDPAAPEVRPTLDVDVITEVAGRTGYYRLAEMLRARGFAESTEPGAPLCRWVVDEIVVDVMPVDAAILGFSNRWYRPALHAATLLELEPDLSIRLVSAPYFLATKIEAFHGRGRGDYLASRDIEDLVAVLDGRPEVVAEAQSADAALRSFLADHVAQFLADEKFRAALPGHLAPDAANQARLPLLLQRLHVIARSDSS